MCRRKRRCRPDGESAVYEGRVEGTLTWPPRGTLGFGVARLIMLSGVNVRGFGPEDPDPPEALERLKQVLPQLLTAQELRELERLITEGES